MLRGKSKMKGIKVLIIKDLLQLKSYRKTLVIFLLIFSLSSITQGIESEMGNMLVVMITLGFGMLSIATFSYDEMAKADRYILTLPLTRKEVVRAKYVLSLGATTMGSILGMIMTVIISLIMTKNIPDIQQLLMLGLGGILGVGLVEAIQIPCIYKVGVEKGRIQMIIITVLVALVFGGIIYMGEKLSINLDSNYILEILHQFLPLILIAMIIAVYGFSYKVSYEIYERKEI